MNILEELKKQLAGREDFLKNGPSTDIGQEWLSRTKELLAKVDHGMSQEFDELARKSALPLTSFTLDPMLTRMIMILRNAINYLELAEAKFPQQPARVGILNKGKNNSFIDNEFSGLNIGIKDEGKGTLALGNKFKENGGFKNSQININSQVHYGKGDNIDKKNNRGNGESFLSKFFWRFIITTLVLVITGVVLKKFFGI